MPTDNVKVLPGVYRAEFEPEIAVATILENARDAGLKDVALVGRQLSGEIVVYGSSPDADRTIGLLVRGTHYLAEAHQVAHKEDD